MPSSGHRGWYKHGRLPHFDAGEVYQFITYRLDDSIPSTMLLRLEEELDESKLPSDRIEMERRRRMEQWMDKGYGSCILRNRENAELVMGAWRHFDGQRYDLLSGVVMPNHVHVLVRVYGGVLLGDLIESWKSYTSRRFTDDGVGRAKPHWQRGYWDRYIRDEGHYRDTVRYISANPVKAGLVARVEDWPYYVGWGKIE